MKDDPRPRPILPPAADVLARELGDPPGRRGARAQRPWWHCPFHEDPNPSLTSTPDGKRYRCFGCGAGGDVIDLVRWLNPGMSFPQALAYLTGDPAPSGERRPRPKPVVRP